MTTRERPSGKWPLRACLSEDLGQGRAAGLAGAVTGALGTAPSILCCRESPGSGCPHPSRKWLSAESPSAPCPTAPPTGKSPAEAGRPPALPSLVCSLPLSLPHLGSSVLINYLWPHKAAGRIPIRFRLLRYPAASDKRLSSLGVTLAEGSPTYNLGPSDCSS